MQFSTIFSVAALVASVVAAPASCEAQATQTSTINCANTPGYNVAQCYINGQFLPYEGSLCSVIQTVTTATAMCCSSQQQGYININIAPCVKAL